MADEVAEYIIKNPRLKYLSMYLQAIYNDLGGIPNNQQLEDEIFKDIETLAKLATQTLAKDKAIKEAKGGEK